jgi:hypothetical protein
MRRHHIVPIAAAFVAAATLAACSAERTANLTSPLAQTPIAQDTAQRTLYGTLRAVFQPTPLIDDGTVTGMALTGWMLEISADYAVQLGGDALGRVPSLDGVEVAVTGHFEGGVLIVESYTIGTL